MESEPTKNGTKPDGRDESGRFTVGNPGGPGRPPGSISITTEIKRKLEEVNPETKKTYLQELIEKIISKATKEGDTVTLKQIWNYIDGMPKQSLDFKGEVQVDNRIVLQDFTDAEG